MDPVLPIFWNLPAPQVLEQLSSAPQGLSATQAETALARFGPNELRPTDRLSGLRLLLKQFASPITLILIAGAILSLFLGDVADATIILIIVVVSGVLGFWQEHGAANTVAKLLAVVPAIEDGPDRFDKGAVTSATLIALGAGLGPAKPAHVAEIQLPIIATARIPAERAGMHERGLFHHYPSSLLVQRS